MNKSLGPICSSGTNTASTDHDLIGDLLGLPADAVAEALADYDLRTLGTMCESELKDAGLTPAEALRTATANAAIALGAENEIGRIKPGLLADIVIVDGDPLTDVSDLLNVSGVLTNGRYRTLNELTKMVSDTD